ncbi:MAG: hypothetical protein WC915_06455 [archaeon]|jgi:hypothetical protein
MSDFLKVDKDIDGRTTTVKRSKMKKNLIFLTIGIIIFIILIFILINNSEENTNPIVENDLNIVDKSVDLNTTNYLINELIIDTNEIELLESILDDLNI